MADILDGQVREEMDRICRKVEHLFSGAVICAYEGFVEARPPMEEGGITLEVFFAPSGSSRQIMRSTYEERDRLGEALDTFVSIVVHHEIDTIRHHLDDVLGILSQRHMAAPYAQPQVAPIIDPGAFVGESASLWRPWDLAVRQSDRYEQLNDITTAGVVVCAQT